MTCAIWGLGQGDLVEVYNDNGATQGDGVPDADRAAQGRTFMLFGFPTGVQGNVVSGGVNEFVIPNYKQDVGEISASSRDAPASAKALTFKSWEYAI